MSMTVLVIGLAHGVPVALTGRLTRNRMLTLVAAVCMCFVAFAVGGDRYVVLDLIGVGLGTWLGWAVAGKIYDKQRIVGPLSIHEFSQRGAIEHTANVMESKKVRAATEHDEAARLKSRLEQADPFIHGLFDKWVAEGKITPCREGSDNLFYQWELARQVGYSIINKSIYSGSLMTVQDDWERLMKIKFLDALLDALNKAAAAGLYSPADAEKLEKSMQKEYLVFLER